MRVEVTSAANFLARLLRLNKESRVISDHQLELFRAAVIETLRVRYRDHWFPERPCKGSGYRCIRINGKMDPVLSQAGELVGLPSHFLHSLFPSELTMWIDPKEVSYRFGENGSICVLYNEQEVEEVSCLSSQSVSSSQSSSAASSPSFEADPRSCKSKHMSAEYKYILETRQALAPYIASLS